MSKVINRPNRRRRWLACLCARRTAFPLDRLRDLSDFMTSFPYSIQMISKTTDKFVAVIASRQGFNVRILVVLADCLSLQPKRNIELLIGQNGVVLPFWCRGGRPARGIGDCYARGVSSSLCSCLTRQKCLFPTQLSVSIGYSMGSVASCRYQTVPKTADVGTVCSCIPKRSFSSPQSSQFPL